MERRSEHVKNAIIVFLEALLLSLQATNTPLGIGGADADSAVFRYVSLVMDNGGMPYLDAFDHKGPLVYVINLIGLHIDYWWGVWVLEFLAMAISLAAVYQAARLLTGRTESHLVSLLVCAVWATFLGGGNLTEEWGLPFITVSGYLLLDYWINDRTSAVKVATCGCCFGAVMMIRPNMVVVWTVFCLAIMARCVKRGRLGTIGAFVVQFFVGAAIVVLPFLLWLGSNNAIEAFVDDYFIFNFLYSSRGVGILKRTHALLRFLKEPIVISSLVCCLCSLKRDKPLSVLLLAYLLLSLMAIGLSGQKFAHYGMVLLPPASLCIAAAMPQLRCWASRIDPYHAVTLGACACVAMSTLITLSDGALVKVIDRPDHNLDGRVSEIARVIQDNTMPEDLITVCGNEDVIYLASHRYSASRFSFQTVGKYNDSIQEGYFADIEANRPAAVVLPEKFIWEDRMIAYLTTNNYKYVGIDSDEKTGVWLRDN